MEGASEEFIYVYKKMMHMFDSVSSSRDDADLKDPVSSVYENFAYEFAAAIHKLKLSFLERKNLSVAVINRVLTLKLELKFLKAAFRCMVKWCIEDDGIQKRFVDVLARIEYHFVRANRLLCFYGRKEKFDEFDEVVSNVLESIESMKPEIVEAYNLLCSWPSPSKYPKSPEFVLEFIYLVIDNLEVLSTCSCGAVSSKRKQVLALKEHLSLLVNLICLTVDHGLDGKKAKEIWIDAEAVADKVAGFSYFLWIYGKVDKKIEIKLTYPNTQQIYAGILKTLLHFDSHFPDEFQVVFFKFLQDCLVELLKDKALMKVPLKNQIETLYEELEFMKDFFISLDVFIRVSILGAEEKEIFDVRIHIKDMARKVGSNICSLLTIENMATALSPALSDMLENIVVSKTEVSAMFSKVIIREKLKFPKVLQVGLFDVFLEGVKELISTKSDMIIDLKDQILAFHVDLEFFKSFFQDIKNRPATDVKLNEVVNRIAVVAYEAEHLINLLVVRACPAWYRSLWVSDLIEEIELTKAAVVEITEGTSNGNRIYNIAAGQGPNLVPSQAFDPNDVVVGVQDQMELVMERLARGTEKLDIVSIVGMPGIGKTTLAKRIYEDPLIVDCFDVRGWCYVSPYYEKKKMLKKMLLSILSCVINLTDQIRKMEDEFLSEMLYKELKGRRYLIFMDDLWGLDALDALRRRSLPDDSIGSRIMLTSRNKLIGSEAQNHSDCVELHLLSEDESWDLLKARVFHQETCPLPLQYVGKQIAKKCNGLPLAVVVVAGVLAKSSKERSSWEQISENLNSHILDDTEGRVMEVLELSYKLLPYYLKPLFLYLGAFSMDKVILVRKLTRQWIAEGFVQKTKLKSLEAEAEKHLMDLIDRSLVIVDRRSNGRIKTCRMHDLLRDLCLTKLEEENFLQRIYVKSSLPYPSLSEIRRLKFHVKQRNRSLRVLDFENDDVIDGYLFADLEMLVSLRYLSTKNHRSSVLSRIVNLRNLETLIVKGLGEIVVPDEIWKMSKLRNLHIDDSAKFNLDDNASENSSKLLNLETFSTPLICHGEEKKLMGRVPNVRKLRCIFQGSWDSNLNCKVFPELVLLDQIESLNVRCHDSVGYPCVFDLSLRLKKLTLSKFRLKWNAISSFQKLPNLEVLKLLDAAVTGESWDVGDDEFPKLKYLKLEGLDIKKWNASSDNFPCLEQLVIRRCGQLVEIPSSLGDIYPLASIVVWSCSEEAANSARRIQEEQQDCGNELLKVHISNTQSSQIELDSLGRHIEEAARQIQEEQKDCGNELLEVGRYNLVKVFFSLERKKLANSARQIQEEQKDCGNELLEVDIISYLKELLISYARLLRELQDLVKEQILLEKPIQALGASPRVDWELTRGRDRIGWDLNEKKAEAVKRHLTPRQGLIKTRREIFQPCKSHSRSRKSHQKFGKKSHQKFS